MLFAQLLDSLAAPLHVDRTDPNRVELALKLQIGPVELLFQALSGPGRALAHHGMRGGGFFAWSKRVGTRGAAEGILAIGGIGERNHGNTSPMQSPGGELYRLPERASFRLNATFNHSRNPDGGCV
ncbi:MAG TPA: hypothetical protein PLM14_13050 [Candidatus Hydrogenedentes bacterium]|nr:hypothetical protein [Candidatus Hydrogenedentota bacterium]